MRRPYLDHVRFGACHLRSWCSAPSPTIPRSSPSGTASRRSSRRAASRSTTCSTRTTSARSRRTSAASSTSRGTRRSRGSRPSASRRARQRARGDRDARHRSRSHRGRARARRRARSASAISAASASASAPADSPQATLIPLLALAGRPARDVEVVRHDVLVGKHGDHVGGERDAVKALLAGTVDAACIIDGNHLALRARGPVRERPRCACCADARRTTTATSRSSTTTPPSVARFRELLLAMSYDDPRRAPAHRPRGPEGVEARPHEGLRAARARVDRFGTLEPGSPSAVIDRRSRRPRPRRRRAPARQARARARRARSSVRGDVADARDRPARRGAARAGHAIERVADGFAIAPRPARPMARRRARGGSPPRRPSQHPPARWGLAARGALVEAGAPALDFRSPTSARSGPTRRARLYAQAAAAQWDPATAIPWDAPDRSSRPRSRTRSSR